MLPAAAALTEREGEGVEEEEESGDQVLVQELLSSLPLVFQEEEEAVIKSLINEQEHMSNVLNQNKEGQVSLCPCYARMPAHCTEAWTLHHACRLWSLPTLRPTSSPARRRSAGK